MVYNHNTNERVIREGMGRTDLNLTSVKTAKKIGGFFAISAAIIYGGAVLVENAVAFYKQLAGRVVLITITVEDDERKKII